MIKNGSSLVRGQVQDVKWPVLEAPLLAWFKNFRVSSCWYPSLTLCCKSNAGLVSHGLFIKVDSVQAELQDCVQRVVLGGKRVQSIKMKATDVVSSLFPLSIQTIALCELYAHPLKALCTPYASKMQTIFFTSGKIFFANPT